MSLKSFFEANYIARNLMNVGVKKMIVGFPIIPMRYRQGIEFTIKLNADPEVKRLGTDAGFECD
jgi:hypothetical protein